MTNVAGTMQLTDGERSRLGCTGRRPAEYVFSLTRVSLRDYVFASWIGMLPGTVMYVYIGSLIGDLGNLGSASRRKTPLEWTLELDAMTNMWQVCHDKKRREKCG